MSAFSVLWLAVALVLGAFHGCESRVVAVSLDSRQAERENGQYLAKFCFRGQTGVFRYSVNQTVPSGALYLFYDEVWPKALAAHDCDEKLQLANIKLDLGEDVTGERLMAQWFEPHYWYVVYADQRTCTRVGMVFGTSDDVTGPPTTAASTSTSTGLGAGVDTVLAELVFLNPDSQGLARNHFGVDEGGLLTFYCLLLIANLAGAYAFLFRMWQGISKGGPMNAAVKMVSSAAVLQIASAFLMAIHLWRYSSDGVGLRSFDTLSSLLDAVSQFLMLAVLISLALGWTMGPSNQTLWSNKKMSGGLTLVAATMLWLFMWEESMDEQHYAYHAHQTWPGTIAVVLCLVVAIFFTANLQRTLTDERSTLKRQFYSQIATGCYIWFFSYPAVVLLGYFFSECRRHTVVVMGVGMSQLVALVLLCRLFLTRSLYWSVSSLGSTMLPLRAETSSLRSDASFRQKLYGTNVHRTGSHT